MAESHEACNRRMPRVWVGNFIWIAGEERLKFSEGRGAFDPVFRW